MTSSGHSRRPIIGTPDNMGATTGSSVAAAAVGSSSKKTRLTPEEEKQADLFLLSQAGVNALLNAQPGKMTLAQLQAAVVDQQKLVKQQEAQVQQSTQAAAGGTGGGDVPAGTRVRVAAHPFDHTRSADVDDAFPGDTAHMREMIFLRSCALYEQHERSLQINPTKHRIGHTLMSEQQRYDLEYARESRKAQEKAAARAASRAQSVNVTGDARVISMVGESSTRQPSFIVDQSDLWPSRKRLLGRFLSSVNKFVVRRRVDERLAALQAHAQHQARRKAKEQESSHQVAHPLSLASVQDEEAHLLRDFQLHTTNVQGAGYTRGLDSVTRTEVEIEPLVTPGRMVLFDEIIPFDSDVLGYASMPAPVVPTYMAFDWLSCLRTGAWEESALRGPRGELDHLPASVSDPSSSLGGAESLASPTAAASSAALLDVDTQSSKTPRTLKPSSPAKKPSAVGSVALPALRSPSSSSNATFAMPTHLLAHHPVAQHHALTSSSAIAVPCEIPSNTESARNYAYRTYTQPAPPPVVPQPDAASLEAAAAAAASEPEVASPVATPSKLDRKVSKTKSVLPKVR